MKTRIFFLTGLTVAAAFNVGAQGTSQSAVSPATPAVHNQAPNTPADCDYNTCALRMKLSWGNWRILRGVQEQRVGTLGTFSAPRIETIVATSPEAVAEARTIRSDYTSGAVLQMVGVLLMAASLGVASGGDFDALPFAGVVGGTGLLYYGVSRHVRAFNALHKTIWIYNGSLKR